MKKSDQEEFLTLRNKHKDVSFFKVSSYLPLFFNQQDLKSKYLIHEFKHSMGFTNFFRRLIFELFFFANADVVTIKDVTSKEKSRNQCRSN